MHLDKECEIIRQREIIDVDIQHDAIEINANGKVLMGPPTLTRFEKARIMGARALQLSLGAPPFIDIPVVRCNFTRYFYERIGRTSDTNYNKTCFA